MVFDERDVSHRSSVRLHFVISIQRRWIAFRQGGRRTHTLRGIFIYTSFFDRDTEFNTILHVDRLFQQCADDQYLKFETHDMEFITKNQEQLRISDYTSLREALADFSHFHDEADLVKPVKWISRPPFYRKWQVYATEKLQYIMGISKKVDNSEIFVTPRGNSRSKEWWKYRWLIYSRTENGFQMCMH